ncbi:MAG: SGNH/GDSL hydrolase family protein [Pseudomonadota bacterium]|nr:SGNH/GDSL hydrolase family protein [Pseudomonadota bacterium]
MPNPLITLSLAPFLILQGRHVRRVTPRLPEPDGARAGQAGSGQLLRLLIIGDSAAAGVGVSRQHDALSGQLVAQLAQHYQVDWQLHATTGHTTAQVLTAIEQLPDQPFDVIVTSTGVNDVTAGLPAKRWLQHKQHLIERLMQKFQPQLIVLTSVPPMHLFPALPQPLRWYLGQHAKQLNAALATWLADQPHCQQLTLDFPIAAEYMASDGFHPAAPAYTIWAEQAAQRILAQRSI